VGLSLKPRLIATGILGGTLAALALYIPLHLILPAAYAPGWQAMPDYAGLVGYAFAILSVVVAGYSAARLSWAKNPGGILKAGAVAGAIAGLIAFLLVGASAAGLSGSGAILQYANQSVGETINTIAAFAEAIVRVSWYTYLTLAVFVVAGALAGALGAGLHRLRQNAPWLAEPRAFSPGVSLLFSLVVFLVSGLTYMVLEVLLTAMPEVDQIGNLQVQLWQRINLPSAGVWWWPKAIMLGVMLLSFGKAVTWITRWLRHPDEAVRKSARLLAVLAAIFSLSIYVILFMALVNIERLILTPLLLATGIGAVVAALRSKQAIDAIAQPFVDFQDLLQGLLLTPLLAALVLIGSSALVWQALQSNVIPFVPGLMGSLETTPLDLIENTKDYFNAHLLLVVKAMLAAVGNWAAVIWPIGWLFTRVAQARFFPYEEDQEA
jgi:hypothetical protein